MERLTDAREVVSTDAAAVVRGSGSQQAVATVRQTMLRNNITT
jgi:hypothetical protein